jgi:hypothetical protein
MLDLENQIVDYFKSDKFENTTPYLSSKNITKNLNLRPKRVKTIMYRSDKFEQVDPMAFGSNIHNNNIHIYKLK